jgi:hypothetical protein
MIAKSRVTILVKALPRPSKQHSETVCCAGIDDTGAWKRLYPIRFRQLSSDQTFARWNVVSCKHTRPTSDTRTESCRVHEESIEVVGKITRTASKQTIVDAALVPSEIAAEKNGSSLALIRPDNVRLTWKKRSPSQIETARNAYEEQAKQTSMFDKQLDALEPCPFIFTMHYDDADGPHKKTCADWETSAAFFKLSRKYSEDDVLKHLESEYCEKYVRTGLVFALGNIAARPQTWQLLGIFPTAPLPPTSQLGLAF